MYTMVRQPKKMLVDGEYVCPVHFHPERERGDPPLSLVQVSAVLDLSVFYGCAVEGCSYRDRFTFVDVINGHLPDLGDRSQRMPTVCGQCGSDLAEAGEQGLKVCVRSECGYTLDTIPIEKLTVGQAMARVAYREERERDRLAYYRNAHRALFSDIHRNREALGRVAYMEGLTYEGVGYRRRYILPEDLVVDVVANIPSPRIDEWKRLLFGPTEEEKVAPVEALVATPAAEAMKEVDQEVARLAEALALPEPTPIETPEPDFLALMDVPNPCAEYFLALTSVPNPCAELAIPHELLHPTEETRDESLQKADPKVCICVGGRSRFCPAH